MVKLRESMLLAETEYGTVLLDSRSGDYWCINDTGALILDVLTAGGSIPDAVTVIGEQYDVPPEQAEEDARDLLAALREHGIVES